MASASPLHAANRFVDRLLVLKGQNRSLTVTYGAPAGDPARSVSTANELWSNAIEIAEYAARLRRIGSPEVDGSGVDLVDLGIRLGWIALPALVRDRFLDELRDEARRGGKLRLWIHDDQSGLGDVPWEYMFVEELEPGFLSLNPACSIVRHCGEGDELGALDDLRSLRRHERLRVLLAYADPPIPHCSRHHADSLMDHVQTHLQRLTWPTDLRKLLPATHTADPRSVATRARFEHQLRTYRPHIVFLLAHGDFDEGRNEGIVFLESDSEAGFDVVAASDFARIVPSRDGPSIIFLNCCWSAARGASAGGRSVARAVSAGGRAVLSMQFPWPAAADPPFWNTLLSSLTVPSPLDDCVSEAREMVARTAPCAPDWGIPVLLRRGLPVPRPSPVVHEPRWARDLRTVALRMRGPDRDLIQKVLRLATARPEASDFVSIVSSHDPLWVILAGEEREQRAIVPSPIWSTRLLEPPHSIRWRTDGRGPWWLSVWVPGGDDLVFRESPEPVVTFSLEETREWPRDVPIRWQVRCGSERTHRPPALVRGIFHILNTDDVRRRRTALTQTLRGSLDRSVGGVRSLLQDGLYEELIRRSATVLRRRPPAAARFVLHRTVAAAYAEIRQQLSLASIGNPEGYWAAAHARQHVEAAYRAVAGQTTAEERA